MTRSEMTYSGYLDLSRLLSAQHPISREHDELLFIIIHQTKELWLKQTIHELRLSQDLIGRDLIIEGYKSLSRISRIQAVMTLSWDVLATMTPTDYTRFRSVLGRSSGFQSAQFREVEFLLGLKDQAYASQYVAGSPDNIAICAALDAPSLWDQANRALARHGFPIPDEVLARDTREPYAPSEGVEEAWAQVYRDTERWWKFYQLAEKLVDIDDAFAVWRHKHVTTVERIIGFKRGTGGTAGAQYLHTTLSKRAFPELWSLRTML